MFRVVRRLGDSPENAMMIKCDGGMMEIHRRKRTQLGDQGRAHIGSEAEAEL